MAKLPAATSGETQSAELLFAELEERKRRKLFLPRLLGDRARNRQFEGPDRDQAHAVVIKWADMERAGQLAQKETALDAAFLTEVFGALGYRGSTDSPGHWERDRQFHVPGAGTADGALGFFSATAAPTPLVVIELKGTKTNLTKDKANGRTAVQQVWDYLNALPACQWGIVSNFSTIRLYHRDMGSQTYERFTLQELRDPDRFAAFYWLFEKGGLIQGILKRPPRALELLQASRTQQNEVGDKLYNFYSDNRLRLIQHLHVHQGRSLEESIRIAQKILDRIIFVAFCEKRDLLPEKLIDTAYYSAPFLARVTNPRWQNFLALFHAIDKGHADIGVEFGYNGGLFAYDPAVDDLQLPDEPWTTFFRVISEYDYRDEVNVTVLGHLFEKSITELERLRSGGLFGANLPESNGQATMKKSAQRKRLGTYYTPPAFTAAIVRYTVDDAVEERFAALRGKHALTAEELDAGKANPAHAPYWHDCLAALRDLKVVDPACGSGAFLIQAYEALRFHYETVIAELAHLGDPGAAALAAAVPDMLLGDNLYGVDLAPESVEITQLSLWIASARRGRTLANLSQNIVCGNSLVTDKGVHASALNWRERFADVFSRPGERGGFDCVIGNPPWERLKLQEREFFALSAPEIAAAVSAATRRQLIAKLEKENPDLFRGYTQAAATAEATLAHVRASGEFPLTAQGDINTYMLFAELGRKIVAPGGRVGLLVPSGISTDKTTAEFFNTLMDGQSLIRLYDFENRKRHFLDVDSRFKFSILVFGGSAVKTPAADFLFFVHEIRDMMDEDRHIALSSADMKRMNPNTQTCPIFRTRRDAELTKAIYGRVPVLIDRTRKAGGNPWGVRFVTMFHQTNDAELFTEPTTLQKQGFKPEGNRWRKGKRVYLPLYEAKMVQAFDHRAASVEIEARNWVRQGQTAKPTLVEHQNPEHVAMPRWWVDEESVSHLAVAPGFRPVSSHPRPVAPGFRPVVEPAPAQPLGPRPPATNPKSPIPNPQFFPPPAPPATLAYKDVTSPTNTRTMIAAFLPRCAVVNSAPLILSAQSPRLQCCLLANLNSVVYDFVARQKVGGVHLNFFIVEQLPTLPPDVYADRCPWSKRQTLESWISERVLKLTCTAHDMRPLAEACKFAAPDYWHKWKPAEREQLRAELDAAYFHLYGINRDDAAYILGTFAGTRGEAEEATLADAAEGDGEVDDVAGADLAAAGKVILEAYDMLA